MPGPRPYCPEHPTEPLVQNTDPTNTPERPWLSWWCPRCNYGHPSLENPGPAALTGQVATWAAAVFGGPAAER